MYPNWGSRRCGRSGRWVSNTRAERHVVNEIKACRLFNVSGSNFRSSRLHSRNLPVALGGNDGQSPV